MNKYNINLVEQENIARIVPEIAELYQKDFIPSLLKNKHSKFYSKEFFIERIKNYSKSPFFEIITCSFGDEIVGFVTAANLRNGGNWWNSITNSSPIDTSENGLRTVAIFDLLVIKKHRGMGLAGLLHAALLTGRSVHRATLLSSPPQHPAFRMWQKWGYQIVGETNWSEGPNLNVLLKEFQ